MAIGSALPGCASPYIPPMAGLAAGAPGTPSRTPRGRGTGAQGPGLLCAHSEHRRCWQLPTVKIAAAGIAEQGEDLL